MDWGNAIVRKISRAGGAADGPVESLEMELHLAGDFKKTKKKVTWIAAPSEVTPVTLLDYDYLITKKKLEEDDKVEELLNPKTEFRCVSSLSAACLDLGRIVTSGSLLLICVSVSVFANAQDRGHRRPQRPLVAGGKYHPV